MCTEQDFITNYLSLRPLVVALCRQMLSDEEQVADAVQDIYLRLWQRRESLERVESARAFLLTTTRNYCLDRLKSLGTKSFISLEGYDLGDTCHTDEKAISRELKLATANWLRQLPKMKKSIITRVHFQHELPQQVAEDLGISEGNLRVILSRLRKELKQLITNL